MFEKIKNIRSRTNELFINVGDAKYKLLAEEVLKARKPNDPLLNDITLLSVFERWLLLSEVLKLKQLNAFHFLHVPKTGGTTFGETLGRDKKVVIVSVDAAPKTLLIQLLRLVNAKPNELVLTRAHHSLRLLIESKCIDNYFLIITAYRDPVEIHVSNINMIMRRLVNYFDQQTMPEAEKLFCEEWADIIGYNFENTSQFAAKLIDSDNYIEQMGSVYSRFFNVRHWKQLVEQKKIVVISSDSFDQMFTDVFDYSTIPERKNVSKIPLLNKEQLSQQTSNLLIGKDKVIASYLSKNLTTPKTLKKLFDVQ